mgnify:CR=1 FL=1
MLPRMLRVIGGVSRLRGCGRGFDLRGRLGGWFRLICGMHSVGLVVGWILMGCGGGRNRGLGMEG